MEGPQPSLPAAGPVPPPPRGVHRRRAALLALSVAVATAVSVLAAQLVTLNTGASAYGPTELALTGPALQPDENPVYAIRDVLARQSAALLHGDRDGYLRTVPPALRDLRTQADQRFASLTALHVRRWSMTTWGEPSMVNGLWQQPVDIGYCFGPGDCTPIDLRIDTSWAVVNGRLQLADYEQTNEPWDRSKLAVKEGRRVTVAGPADDDPVSGALLDRVLHIAERSTATTDRFATSFDGAPRRYFLYVAGSSQWPRWYGGAGPYAAAYTWPLQPGASDVVIDRDFITSDEQTTTILTHEFGHVVTLDGTEPPASAWWLVEGSAEYIANGDGSALRADLPVVRAYLAKKGWDGTVALGPLPEGASLVDGVARYGIALLAVTYLAKRFGEAKMLAFLARVVRERATVQAASAAVFGVRWQAVSKDAAASIRATAG